MKRISDICSEGWVYPKSFIHSMLEIGHVFQIVVGWTTLQTNALNDFTPEFLDHPRISRQLLKAE